MNCAVYYHCAEGVAFRKDCPNGKLYDINQHKCLLIPEVRNTELLLLVVVVVVVVVVVMQICKAPTLRLKAPNKHNS